MLALLGKVSKSRCNAGFVVFIAWSTNLSMLAGRYGRPVPSTSPKVGFPLLVSGFFWPVPLRKVIHRKYVGYA